MAGRRRRLISPLEAEEVDHISRLPEDIIHRIFSFLPFKDVVKTGVLSKQWRFAWTSTPYIDLSIPSKEDVAFIVRALRRCTATKIEKFHLDVPAFGSSVPWLLDCWNPFDSARKVEDVSLGSKYMFELPKILFDCASLVSLRVSKFHFSGDIIVTWPSLKKLCLHDVWLRNDEMKKILSGCPALKSLVLCFFASHGCNLQINSGSLRELVINAIYKEGSPSLDIWAPNMLSLRLLGALVYTDCRLKEVSSLVEAQLNFSITGVPRYSSDRFMLFLEQLQHVPKITIGSRCLEVLSLAKRKEIPCLSSRWRNIMVYTTDCKRDLLGMTYLLQSSPLLERLAICNLTSSNFRRKNKNHVELPDFDEKQFWHSQKEFYCVANHLKRVEIVVFQFDNKESKPWLALARFILEETGGLQKMTIDAELSFPNRRVSNFYDHRCVRDVIHLQACCQKGSQNAEVIVISRLNGHPYELCKHKYTRYVLKRF